MMQPQYSGVKRLMKDAHFGMMSDPAK